jgi:hypothetical protein
MIHKHIIEKEIMVELIDVGDPIPADWVRTPKTNIFTRMNDDGTMDRIRFTDFGPEWYRVFFSKVKFIGGKFDDMGGWEYVKDRNAVINREDAKLFLALEE